MDKRETHPKKKLRTAIHMEKNPTKVEVRTCVHAHSLKEITALAIVTLSYRPISIVIRAVVLFITYSLIKY